MPEKKMWRPINWIHKPFADYEEGADDILLALRGDGLRIDLKTDSLEKYLHEYFGLIPTGMILEEDAKIIYGSKARGVLVFIPDNYEEAE